MEEQQVIYGIYRKDDPTKGYIGSSQAFYERIKSYIKHTRYRINRALHKHGIP